MTQVSLWQEQANSSDYAELCNALYEREVRILAQGEFNNISVLQGRLLSLSHYISRAAHLMVQAQTPMQLDVQNASWSSKQASKLPMSGQEHASICAWYLSKDISLGLVVPVYFQQRVLLDCVDRLDRENLRIRTNVAGWFSLSASASDNSICSKKAYQLLKPNKKLMQAACSGHRWQDNKKVPPSMLSLRELLLSCSINWQNFKKPLTL
ncbi:hypothetical protein [Litorilituus sediminis]|uniref:Uncharacterized protein n=1 Tax=Litorilituus sediminis TaxID=718192 RepID=A0A4P6P7I8_9GAMM|nr:hypothetical protein [Litorilituus sediminis]QBG35472.1 hypothetical protein EMK97_06940 [Litorilituus sediminis]